ncbi:MAG: type IV pilus twitching motility protein PilT [Candidatus Baltobacteraceae bacterium]
MSAELAQVRIEETLRVARSRGASDVHLTSGAAPVFRVNGVLESQNTLPIAFDELHSIATLLLDQAMRAHLERDGDVTVMYRATGCAHARAHLYKTHQGTNVAFRLLAAQVPTLESLHLPAVVQSFAVRSGGLILFAGPTGSGKSTALAGLVDRINRTSARHIITIEDPVEYRHEAVSSVLGQREIGTDVPSFARAVYGALRCDPDVLLIGEMRTAETMHAALTAAETGHLVLSTLHTGDAVQTIDRIIGSFEGALQEQVRISLAQTLVAAICLRLVPALCGGRRPAAEVLLVNHAVRNLIREGKTHQIRNVMETSRNEGMQTLEAHLGDLVARGDVCADAALAAAARPDALQRAMAMR